MAVPGLGPVTNVFTKSDNVGFSALRAKIREKHPIFTRKSATFGANPSVFFSFPGQIFFFRPFVKRGGSFQREARSMSDFF